MSEYYKLRKDLSIELFGRKLFRIECIKELKNVKIGELGGYIEKEENLTGNAWVYGDAMVYGNARVYGDAEVYGDAWVSGDKIQKKNDVCNVTGQAYNITITTNHIKIGCQYHSKTAWFKFRDSEIEKMDGQQALDFWKVWKPILKSICEKDK